jgi:endonuclease/exonuclease/phosphatase (EEP) superfamily protein YafD
MYPTLDQPTRHTAPKRPLVNPRRRATDPPRAILIRKVVTWLSWANLAALVGVFVLLCVVSERWWLSTALAFLPRSPWGIPAAVLLVASLLRTPWMAVVNGISLILVAAPIMGLTMPSATPSAPGPESLRVITSNIQFGSANPKRLAGEMERLKADLVLLQEAHDGSDEFEKLYRSWSVVHVKEFWVGSKYPVKLIGEFRCEAFDRLTAIACEVRTPGGPIVVVNAHLATPRYALGELRWHTPLTGAGVEAVEDFLSNRRQEAADLRKFADEVAGGRPVLLGGDLNTPALSSTLAETWAGWTSAFDVAGNGYGYTSPCNTDSLWPNNTPWVRIDHVFCDARWSVHSAEIGTTNGSDHRLLFTVATPAHP